MALVLVLASPFAAMALRRWRLLGPEGSMVDVGGWLVAPVAALSLAAGLIHLAVIPDHLAEDTLSGLFFVVVSITQIGWAIAFARRPHVPLAASGLALNVAVGLVWLVTRTVGLPFGAHPFVPEPVGLAGASATAAELLIVFGTALLAVPRLRDTAARSRHPVASADLALVLALVAISLATGFALSDVAITGGH
jgi:hypothetical protein